MILYIIGYILIASMVTAVFSVIYEGREVGASAAALTGALWLPMIIGAVGYFLLVGVPYKLTQLLLDRLQEKRLEWKEKT